MTEDPARKAFNAIVDVLQPLDSPDRKRAVLGALHFLEEDWVPLPQVKGAVQVEATEQSSEMEGAFPAAVKQWMKKNELTAEEVENVFHFEDGKVNIIADLPGKGKRENTTVLYILLGLGTYIFTGERKFADSDARDACSKHSAYDSNNHAGTMAALKSELTGDKKAGWTITMPGLKRGAALVKELAVAK